MIDVCERDGKAMGKLNDSGFKGAQVLRESNLSGDFFFFRCCREEEKRGRVVESGL